MKRKSDEDNSPSFLNDASRHWDEGMSALMQMIVSYFDDALPQFLLYAEEEESDKQLRRSSEMATQSSDEIELQIRPSDVYGAKHLVRLLILMPQLLKGEQGNVDDEEKLEMCGIAFNELLR